jgi:hypothetical protein
LGRRQVHQGVIGEVIIEDSVGALQNAPAFPSNQVGIAGTRSDEVNLAHTL